MDGRVLGKILVLIVIFFGTIFVVNRIDNRGSVDGDGAGDTSHCVCALS